MVAWLGLPILLAVSGLLVYVDRRTWGTSLTPGALLLIGYAGVALLFTVVAAAEGARQLGLRTYMVLSLLGCLTMLTSFVVRIALGWEKRYLKIRAKPSGAILRNVVLMVALTFALTAYDRANAVGGVWSSESIEALSHGVVGHLHVLLAFFAIWYAASSHDGPALRNLVVVAALAAMTLYPVKGWTLIPALAIGVAIALRGHVDGTSSVKPILAAGLLGILVFFGIYFSRGWTEGIDTDLAFNILGDIAQHFLFYLTAGLVGLDGILHGLELHGGMSVLIAPLVNIGAELTGDEFIPVISDVFVPSPFDHPTGGNVFSLVGTAIGYAGPIVGVLFVAAVVAVSYALFAFSSRSRIAALRVASLYVTASLAFGWFDYYFSHLTPYEIGLFALAAGALSPPPSRCRAVKSS